MASHKLSRDAQRASLWNKNLRRRVDMPFASTRVAPRTLWTLLFSPDHRVQVTDPSLGAAVGVDGSTRFPKELPNG